ncbi:hypothetical protein BD413DRAFT_249528 [Trametes elegans]|nr:hypothetical protein BD413DRAFT_249528 [Trametes elegans]
MIYDLLRTLGIHVTSMKIRSGFCQRLRWKVGVSVYEVRHGTHHPFNVSGNWRAGEMRRLPLSAVLQVAPFRPAAACMSIAPDVSSTSYGPLTLVSVYVGTNYFSQTALELMNVCTLRRPTRSGATTGAYVSPSPANPRQAFQVHSSLACENTSCNGRLYTMRLSILSEMQPRVTLPIRREW